MSSVRESGGRTAIICRPIVGGGLLVFHTDPALLGSHPCTLQLFLRVLLSMSVAYIPFSASKPTLEHIFRVLRCSGNMKGVGEEVFLVEVG